MSSEVGEMICRVVALKISTRDAGDINAMLRALSDEIERLRIALRLAAEEPNIDKARAIADAVLEEKR